MAEDEEKKKFMWYDAHVVVENLKVNNIKKKKKKKVLVKLTFQ